MLTKDLLLHHTRNGRIRPTFIDTSKASLRDLAKDLVAIVESSVDGTRGELEEALAARATATRRTKVAKGLAKLAADRALFEDPDPDMADRRMATFEAATSVFRSLPPGASIEDYQSELSVSSHVDGDLDAIRADLFADLAERRRVLGCKPDSAGALLDRYNMALAQGIVMHAKRLDVEVADPDIRALRRVLRALKFNRLVAEIDDEDGDWILRVEGPAAQLSMQKKYGFQLALFLPYLPLLGHYWLRAEIAMPRKSACRLELSHTDPLVSPHGKALGHIPEEIARITETFADDDWALELVPEPRHVGATGVCVPDLSFVHGKTGVSVFVELFHRWHKGPLLRRLDDLATRPDEALVLGVDRALLSNEALAAKVADHEQVLLFSAFPSSKKLKGMLRRFE